jgi:hypothetical protein
MMLAGNTITAETARQRRPNIPDVEELRKGSTPASSAGAERPRYGVSAYPAVLRSIHRRE